ncbi:cytochrome c class I [Panacibacter sp. DH6]|uniref:Cytochrome c class I n=1 Tax=Panacibacter microcysteis TaxID=2793269 RepID=A0A931GYD2_9BACT|nr:c-type cytochrome [Panacibacter microcysteis]MBG9375387.1 cytochrome c class I [Panacibacter microcysteis]
MKKYFVSAALVVLVAACGGGNSDTAAGDSSASASTTEPAATSGDVTENPDYKAGLALIGKSDCLTCHKATEKLIGPAYKEVAQKYAGVDTAVAYLSKKVIEGGSGVWGSVPMTAHPQISQADAEQMVKYVLLLKDAQ